METREKNSLKTLKGITLNVGILQGNDYEYDCEGSTELGNTRSAKGYGVYILSLLQDALEFNVRFVPAASWGHFERSNKTWTGLARLVADNSTDVNACHWSMNEHLAEISEILLPTLETTESLVYLPANLPLDQDVFVQTFSHRLWIFFLVSICLIVVSLKFSTSIHSNMRPDHESWSWDEVLLWAVAAVSQQSYSRHPRGSSCRTTFLIGYFITYLLYTGFAAGVTSLLALQGHQNQLSLFDVNRMKLSFLPNDDEYSLCFSQNFLNPKFILTNSFENEKKRNLSQVFSAIKRRNSVGFGSSVAFQNFLKNRAPVGSRNNVHVTPISRTKVQKGFLARKLFPFKKTFNFWLLRLKEVGLLDFGKKKFLELDENVSLNQTRWLSASFGNVISAFVFLFGGGLFSVFILFLEMLTKSRNGRRK